MRAVVADQSQFIRDDIAGRVTKKDEQIMARLWRTPEMQFFFRVWMPCMVVNDMTPVELMRKAQRRIPARQAGTHQCPLRSSSAGQGGNCRAVHRPVLRRLLRRRRATAFKRMAKALATPSKTLRPSQVKGYLTGYISKIASASGAPSKVPSLQTFLIGVARDMDEVKPQTATCRRARRLPSPSSAAATLA